MYDIVHDIEATFHVLTADILGCGHSSRQIEIETFLVTFSWLNIITNVLKQIVI